MKYLITSIIAFTFSCYAFSQDKIVKNDNSVVEGTVLKVDDTNIEIDPTGKKPFLIVPRTEAKLIIYDDNTVVSFEKESNVNPYIEDMRLQLEAAEILLKEMGIDETEEEIRRMEELRKSEEQTERINNLGRNSFGRQGAGEQDGSEGVKPGDGNNQGTSTGSPGASNYGDGSGLGDGLDYGLGSRKVVGQFPIPNVNNCNVTNRIIVEIAIQVDRSGNVVQASVKSATFADDCIWQTVLEAAKRTRFTSDKDAPFKQAGWIKYTIEP